MRDVVKFKVHVTDDLYETGEDYFKISVYNEKGIEPYTDFFLNEFAGEAQGCISGKLWIDYTAMGVNKGAAIKRIQEMLGIEPSECMALGDNFNDIEMFDAVGHPVVMATAADEVKKHAREEITRVEDYINSLLKGELL